MSPDPGKGTRTANSILDAAEHLFAHHGYAGTSLRAIAAGAGLREPGLYNHFHSKQAIHCAVMERAVTPIGDAMLARIAAADSLPEFIELPALLVDILAERPALAALLQRALRDEEQLAGNRVFHQWLDTLFEAGMERVALFSSDLAVQREVLAINLVAILNLATGYFLSQAAFDTMAAGHPGDGDNLNRHKQLLHRVIRAMMVS